MRRGAVAECIDEEAELRLPLLLADAEEFEDAILHVGAVDPDRTRTEFPAVEHEVVGLRADLQQVLARTVEQIPVVLVRHRERMVRRDRLAVVGDRLEQREVDDPEEVESPFVHRRLTEFETQQAEHVAHETTLVGDEEDHVAGLGLECGDDL